MAAGIRMGPDADGRRLGRSAPGGAGLSSLAVIGAVACGIAHRNITVGIAPGHAEHTVHPSRI